MFTTLVILCLTLRTIECSAGDISNSKLYIENGRLLHFERSNESAEFDSSDRHFATLGKQNGRVSGEPFDWMIDDFVMTDLLPDGERERRIRFRGITAKETSVGKNGSGLILRQVSEGSHFVQTISNMADEMMDCEYIDDLHTAKKFVRDFRKEISYNFVKRGKKPDRRTSRKEKRKKYFTKIERQYNSKINNHRHAAHLTARELEDEIYYSKNPNDFDDFIDEFSSDHTMKPFRSSDRFKRDTRFVGKKSKVLATKDLTNTLKNVTVLRLNQDISKPSDVASWLDIKKMEKLCDRVHRLLEQSLGISSSHEEVEEQLDRGIPIRRTSGITKNHKETIQEDSKKYRPFKNRLYYTGEKINNKNLKVTSDISLENDETGHALSDQDTRDSETDENKNLNDTEVEALARNKRSFLIAPGMLWCGAGQLAKSPSELGELRSADVCCRAHDLCGGGVPGMGRRNGFLNLRPFTVSRCHCDRRFRACLKLANTDSANMVGRLFFNIVQTKCFVLKPAKVCTKRSWWGKCLEVGYSKQAHLRDNHPF